MPINENPNVKMKKNQIEQVKLEIEKQKEVFLKKDKF